VLHWLVEKILDVVNFLPALFVEQNSPRFEIVRGLFGLLFVLLVLIVFGWWQKRSSSKVSARRNANTGPNQH
jgi:high-affinity Fe2+/Pb2+ permease